LRKDLVELKECKTLCPTFWDPLLRAAALAQLGREQEAAQAVAELLQLRQDFSINSPFLIDCYVKSKDLADALLDGLRLAGLKI
jgi:hypothetical protein